MAPAQQKFRIDHVIAAILLFTMASITFINVLSRYFFHFSFAATEEITINLFVWLTVVGSGIAFERGAQLGMVTLFKIFPLSLKKVAVMTHSGLATVLFIILNIYMIQSIYDEVTIFHATSGALGLPVWMYYLGVTILSVFVFQGIYRDLMTKLAAFKTEASE
jgi:TRAP-type C4-dicarboxylate transport system permease small subunit